jgi:hypothetical protein
MPPIYDKNSARKLISLRHPEYDRSVRQAQWLLDTLSADGSYREATYDLDPYGQPRGNLHRLPQELPLRSADGKIVNSSGNPFNSVMDQPDLTDASYEMFKLRRDRTPVPQFLPMFVDKIMGKIYKRKIERTGPANLIAWTENVDSRRTSLDEFMRDTVAPILCSVGMIDVAFDHPAADPLRPGLFGEPDPAGCVVKIILPEHMLWWIKDTSGFFYVECMVREYVYDEIDNKYVYQFRHWTWQDWTLYDPEGNVLGTGSHSYMIAPIVRLFDKKSIRSDDVARSRFWGVADKSRTYYNEESELILNNTFHNCPILQGPPDDGSGSDDDGIPIGRNLILKMVPDRNGNPVGYQYLTPSSEPNQFMVQRLSMIQGQMEAEAGLSRSVGAVGQGGEVGPVAQSGISKAYDQQEGGDYLAGIARMLGTNDYAVLLLALIVLSDGGATESEIRSISSNYPSRFNLLTFDQIAIITLAIQQFKAGSVGQVPEGDKQTLKLMYRELHPDLDGDTMRLIETQVDEYVDGKAEEWKNRPKLTQLTAVGPALQDATGAPVGTSSLVNPAGASSGQPQVGAANQQQPAANGQVA